MLHNVSAHDYQHYSSDEVEGHSNPVLMKSTAEMILTK